MAWWLTIAVPKAGFVAPVHEGEKIVMVDAINHAMAEELERIAARVDETSDLVGRITDAAREQASGLEQVSSAVGELDGVT